MDSSVFGQLSHDIRHVVMTLLACIVEDADTYRNQVLMLSGDGETQYILEVNDANGAHQCRQSYPGNIVPILSDLGLAVPMSHTSFRFLPSAMKAYGELTNPSDDEIRRRIGQELYRIWKRVPNQHISAQHDLGELTDRLGITRQQYFEGARVLCALGLAEEGKHAENSLENGNLDLTSPAGVQWAAAGFSKIGDDLKPVVNVTVNIALQQVFHEVERLPIGAADKERIEELFRQFDTERHKAEPSYKPLQDLLDMASKVKELAPLLIRFGANHLDDIERMAHHVPGF